MFSWKFYMQFVVLQKWDISNSSLYHIFESDNLGFPFSCEI